MSPPDWIIGLTLAAMAVALAAICFRLGKACANEALESKVASAKADKANMRDDLEIERQAHEATTLRCSDAEARLAQISLLAAPKAE